MRPLMAHTASELCSLRAALVIFDEITYQQPPGFLSIGCALVDSFLCWPRLFALRCHPADIADLAAPAMLITS